MKIVLSLFTVFALIGVLNADSEVINDVAHMDVMTVGGEAVQSVGDNVVNYVEEMPSTVVNETSNPSPAEEVVEESSNSSGDNASYYYEDTNVDIYPVDGPIPSADQDSGVVVSESLAGDNSGVDNGYYVQMIAFSKSAPDALISKLESKGFNNYKFQNVGEITRLIVGPYSTRREASKVLKQLKRVKRDAFIYKQ